MVVIIKGRKNVYKHSYQFHLFCFREVAFDFSAKKNVFLDHQIIIETSLIVVQNKINKNIQLSGDN